MPEIHEGNRGWGILPPSALFLVGGSGGFEARDASEQTHSSSSRCFSSTWMFWFVSHLISLMNSSVLLLLLTLAWNFESLRLFSEFNGKILEQVGIIFDASLNCFQKFLFEVIIWKLRT